LYYVDLRFLFLRSNPKSLIFAKKIMGVADMLFKRKKEQAEKNLKDGKEYMEEYGKEKALCSYQAACSMRSLQKVTEQNLVLNLL
jgi:hypothetical protein